jgi:hypothetical protein
VQKNNKGMQTLKPLSHNTRHRISQHNTLSTTYNHTILSIQHINTQHSRYNTSTHDTPRNHTNHTQLLTGRTSYSSCTVRIPRLLQRSHSRVPALGQGHVHQNWMDARCSMALANHNYKTAAHGYALRMATITRLELPNTTLSKLSPLRMQTIPPRTHTTTQQPHRTTPEHHHHQQQRGN